MQRYGRSSSRGGEKGERPLKKVGKEQVGNKSRPTRATQREETTPGAVVVVSAGAVNLASTNAPRIFMVPRPRVGAFPHLGARIEVSIEIADRERSPARDSNARGLERSRRWGNFCKFPFAEMAKRGAQFSR